ncbi:MAG TPA: DUF5118 domain-containing protein, partial [Caldimonas sp.]
MPTFRFVPVRALALLVATGAVLTGCTTFQTINTPGPVGAAGPAASGPVAAPGPGGAASGLRPPGAPPVAVAPGGLRPFAEVIKEARRSDGLLTVWQKDDKVWLELKPDDFNRLFFLSPKLKTGIGERNFYGGSMLFGDSGVVAFRRIHNQIQMVWLNVNYAANAGSPEALSIE